MKTTLVMPLISFLILFSLAAVPGYTDMGPLRDELDISLFNITAHDIPQVNAMGAAVEQDAPGNALEVALTEIDVIAIGNGEEV